MTPVYLFCFNDLSEVLYLKSLLLPKCQGFNFAAELKTTMYSLNWIKIGWKSIKHMRLTHHGIVCDVTDAEGHGAEQLGSVGTRVAVPHSHRQPLARVTHHQLATTQTSSFIYAES